ncbi:MAG: N-acetylmuramoyl-L-alanine amidase, partial [Micrococcales bacterium]|nr:N-acetylmuramoyl-L-alanine amidase [Micrococcales bacterium]
MARHLTAAEIRDAFRIWNVPAIYEPGWETRGNGGSWGDLGFLLMHHTGDDLPDNVSKNMLRDGRPGLSGPLCNFAPRDDGRLHVIAAGPANHAGTGDPRVLAAVRAESYGAAPPAPRFSQGQAGGVGGNSLSMGWESMYAGKNDPTINPLQYRVAVLSQAAISWKLTQVSGDHWTGKSTLGHKEWQRGKPDPAGIVMATQRADIDWCLTHGPAAAWRWYDTGLKST